MSDVQRWLLITMAIYLVIALVIATIPASIAARKGHSWWAFYWFGLFFMPFALTTAYLIGIAPPRPARAGMSTSELVMIVGATVATFGVLVFTAFQLGR